MEIELFRALGDPVRMELIQRLASGAPHTLTTLSDGLAISRQGVRKHIQILVDSEVVFLESKGRDTKVSLNRKSLQKAKNFIKELENLWDKRLEALRDFVEV